MAKQDQKSAANDMQSMFDPQNYQNVFKTWANMNERLTSIIVDAGQRSTEIVSEATHESLANLREMTQVRDEPAEYTQAYTDFVQKQMDLVMRSAQSMAEVSKTTGSKSAELASDAGETRSDKVSENVERATDKASAAADKATSSAKKAA